MKKFLTLAALALMTLSSCGTEEPITSKSNYLLIGPGMEGLIYRAKNDSINICETARNSKDKSVQREFFKNGLKLWWAALDLPEKEITYDKQGAECDLTVEVRRGVHAHCMPGKRPKIVVDVPSGRMGRQRVVTHELGHAFGLDDTYALREYKNTGRMSYSEENRCKPGQTDVSIMCNPEKYGEPQDDDIKGVKHAYRNVHGDN